MHCSPEQLALAALGEPRPARESRHLQRCATCRDRVASLRRGVDVLAVPEFATAGPAVPPPPAVWQAIAGATGVRMSPRPDRSVGRGAAVTAPPQPEPAAENLDTWRRQRVRRSTDLPPVRRRPVLAAAAVAAVLGAGIALGAVAIAHRAPVTQVAATQLRSLDRSGASGTAVVVQHADHTLDLQVTLRGPRPASGYYEAWLADAGLGRMVAVGAVHEGTTDLPVPRGVRPGNFPVVDISVQQLDGNPAHSDHSVARGLLR